MDKARHCQVIMATHAPLLMAYPGASLLSLTRHGLAPTKLEATDHYRLLSEFCANPAAFVDTMLES